MESEILIKRMHIYRQEKNNLEKNTMQRLAQATVEILQKIAV